MLAPRVGFIEPWRLVTSMFGHALSIFHIGFNMYALWVLGRSLEPFLGRARFLAAYLMSGLGGGALLLFISGISWQAHLGGFLTGIVCGVIFFEDPKRVRSGKSPQTWPRMALLLLIMVAALVVKYLVV